MTVQFALDYIPRRLRELGYGEDYITRWRHFQLGAGEAITIKSYNEIYLLIEPVSGIKVRSKTGLFDSTDTTINEMQYEHKGKIQVGNNTHSSLLVLFIQIIPNHI
ncbi:MAG: hypothetical protein ACXVNO_01435 [Bacteroidia bacterium]